MSVVNAPMSSPREHHRHHDRPSLSRLVAERSWDWLRELCAPLRLDLQIIDATLRPVLPPEAGGTTTGTPSVGSGVDEAVLESFRTQRERQFVAGHTVTLFVPLLVRGEAIGVLALTRGRQDRKTSPGSAPDRLTQVGAWLAAAVTRHLASAVGQTHDLAPLIRALEAGSTRGSDRELIAVFAEAMAVWHDVEVIGCVEVGQGTYVREVGIGALARPGEPVALPVEAIPASLRLAPLSPSDVEGLVPTAVAGAVATTLTRQDGQSQWLLVFTGATEMPDAQLLLNYIVALDLAMGCLTAGTCAGVAAAALRHAPGDRPSLRAGLRAVLSEVSTRLAADAVVLVAEFPALEAPIHLGSIEALPRPRVFDRNRLAVVKRGRNGEAVLLGIRRTGGGDFTPLERRVVETAAESILAWGVPGHVRPPHQESPCLAALERLAQEALERGSAVTAVVVATTNQASSRDQDGQVDRIRRGLRQSDEVCALRSGEVGLLLRDATAADAAAVAKRIDAALRRAHGGSAARFSAIGFETRLPGKGAAAGIVGAARLNSRRPLDAR